MRFLLALALLSLFASPAAAQRSPSRAALEIGFDHGVSQLREPGQDIVWSGATAALDVRLHGPEGFGGMLRVGTTFGRVLTLEVDLAPTFRTWLHHAGPRGLELGGGLGASLYYNAFAPRLGLGGSLLGGAMITVQLDYREHGFFVGIGYLSRWLPIGDTGGLETFSFAATLRVGGEVSL